MSAQKHIRNTFLTGIFAAIPIAITVFIIWKVESETRAAFGLRTPFLGVLVAIAAIYVLGLIVNSLIGKLFIRLIDSLLSKIPVLRDLYEAWKHITVTPGGKEGIFGKVCLIPVEGGNLWTMGFTSGDPVAGDPNTVCVFVPAAPAPTSGRLYFVPKPSVRMLTLSPEEAFKIILSGGNYLPEPVGTSCRELSLPAKGTMGGN